MCMCAADKIGSPTKVTHPFFDSVWANQFNEAKEKGKDFFATHLNFEEKNKFYQDLLSYVPEAPEETKEFLFSCPGLAGSTVLLENVSLYIENFSGIPYTDEENAMLMRFGKVFEQSYTRFLDLQKEAQAREARIEAALEKVRSRSLAMHRSNELKDVVAILFQQLKILGVGFDGGAAIHLFSEDSKDAIILVASPELTLPIQVNLPYDEEAFVNNPIISDVWKAKETGKNIFNKLYSSEEKDKYFEYVFKHNGLEIIPQLSRDFILQADSYTASFISEKNSLLGANSWSRQLFSENDFDILKRIAKVFEQAYVRFLDLQKAEAQAREAKIEAALEKVRSRSLAMHESDDLNEVVTVVFEKLKELKIPVTSAGINIYIEGSKDTDVYVCGQNEDRLVINNYRLPYFNHSIANDLYNVRKKGLDFFVGHYSIDEKNSFYEHVFEHSELRHLPDDVKSLIRQSRPYSIAMAPVNNSMIVINDFEGNTFSEREADVLKRFARVFEQAYTRFLDLQKAEAQAREAKIEAALERVRSRAMAMHKTDELLDAAELLYKELTGLGITSMNVSYAFVDDEEKYASYYSLNPVVGKIPPFPFVFPHAETEVMRSILSSWKKQESFNVIELDQEATLKHQTWVGEHIQATITENNIAIPFSVEAFLAISPQTAVIYTFHFTQGYIFIIGEERLSAMQEEMVLRFTKVFEMTYRRFLDLKQAEAQTREAQIELALERIRARTMAMQKK